MVQRKVRGVRAGAVFLPGRMGLRAGRHVHRPLLGGESPGTPVELRIVLDRPIAEIYLSTSQVLPLRFYAIRDGPWRLQARSTGMGDSAFTVEAWDLKSRCL